MWSYVNLAFNVGQALNMPERRWIRSVFGERTTWRRQLDADYQSEYAAGYPLTLAALDTATRVLLAPRPHFPWDTSLGSGRIDYPAHEEARAKFPRERWFLINGICTDRRVVELNATMIYQLFGRPLTVLYNSCNGVVLDLIECAVGKEWQTTTDAAATALPELLAALRDPSVARVVLLSHSQGTIVAAVLLKALEELMDRTYRGHRWNRHEASPERKVARKLVHALDTKSYPSNLPPFARVQRCLTPEEIQKLELYNFANCATSMEPFLALNGRMAPWIESYGNEFDLVARLGVLAPTHGIGSARIGGDRYIRRGTWGHLLNTHYLYDMVKEYEAQGSAHPALEPFVGNVNRRPRLFDYMRGEGRLVASDELRERTDGATPTRSPSPPRA